jgi:hypothetical protein
MCSETAHSQARWLCEYIHICHIGKGRTHRRRRLGGGGGIQYADGARGVDWLEGWTEGRWGLGVGGYDGGVQTPGDPRWLGMERRLTKLSHENRAMLPLPL